MKGKYIMNVRADIEPEELSIALPGFMFSHTYSDIQIMVAV